MCCSMSWMSKQKQLRATCKFMWKLANVMCLAKWTRLWDPFLRPSLLYRQQSKRVVNVMEMINFGFRLIAHRGWLTTCWQGPCLTAELWNTALWIQYPPVFKPAVTLMDCPFNHENDALTRTHRNVSYYARSLDSETHVKGKLCISSTYLCESGFSAFT